MEISTKMRFKRLLKPKIRRAFFLSIFNSLFLIFVTILLQNEMIFQPKAEGLGSWGYFFKNIIFKNEQESDPKRFLFVDTSTSNAIVQDDQPPFNNKVVVNRDMLTTFFEYLKDKQLYKYVIADIVFEDQTASDSAFQSVINNFPRFITCSYTNEKGELKYPIINASCGLCDIETVNGNFLKYKLKSKDGEKSLPLKVFMELNPSVSKNKLNIKLNSFILNIRLNKRDIYTLTELNTLLFLEKDVIEDFSRDRIVVIGDFRKNDNVSTAVGEIPGPLILTNVILALENKDNILTISKLFILFLGFFILSFIAIYPEDLFNKLVRKIPEKLWYIRFLIRSIGVVVLLSLCTMTYYVVFSIYLNIIYLGGYFFVLDTLSNNYSDVKNKFGKFLPKWFGENTDTQYNT